MLLVRFWYDKLPPEIEVHENNQSFRIKFNEISNKYLSKERFCIGYLRFNKKYVPHGIKLEKGYRCRECELKDYWIPCSRCNGTRCLNPHEEARRFCLNTRSYVYLAYFGGRIVKVGVAMKNRLKERLLEQGAIAYTIYDEAINGFEARKIETRLKQKFVDKLTYKQKVKLYKNIDLDWFDKVYGIDGILDYNYENVKLLNNKTELKTNDYIPKVIGSIGQIIITNKGYISFNKLKGRKMIDKKNIMSFINAQK